ncbi:hypothetical protein ABVK25_003536 [Lepraria finkii]|uniref:Phosphatidate phosphatase APP1 catalytic domain-containing protein n=1 Tax=Lepraria finkii TaxID=1340010 RepID=A0ABR4BGH0_9LECA
MDGNSGYGSLPERGARRKKLAGYLKAANELRQSYQQAYGMGGQRVAADDNASTIPGQFPDVAVVRSGDEEMLLFPSYARRHYSRKPRYDIPGASQDIRSEEGSGDAEYWRKEWEKYEDDNAVVDVDIRGWIYSPHKGQMTRKNRLLVGIARQLSGIPATSSSRASSPHSQHHLRVEARNARYEEEQAEKEAEAIARRGQGEADIAWRGGYSESPSRDADQASLYSSPSNSRASSPDRRESHGTYLCRPVSNSSLRAENDHRIRPLSKRTSWTQPSDMTSAELSVANSHLMVRLRPFLTTPLVNTTLTCFFYNEQASRSRTITTNEAGHFNVRAAIDFVPTHVRVLASDRLSATEEVRITEPKGFSVISDIDDTIKHSGIGNGARDIFRNAFVRDVADLTIDGVKEWYTRMADLGVTFHYVSNSPWQLYPVLTSFFTAAGLPKGSFHLKQYTGMLQGIFEPVAERKKGTLDKILSDFPERRFILAGDSGEADLELYTDIMLANPGRILGVFIRDVTTTKPPGFFDSAVRPRGSRSPLRGRSRDNTSVSPQRRSLKVEEKPPALPPRQPSCTASTLTQAENGPTMGRLIDFDEEPSPGVHRSLTDSDMLETERKMSTTSIKSNPPSRPSKPLALRSLSGEQLSSSPPLNRKPAPPLPPKPRQNSNSQEQPNLSTEPSPLSQTQNASPPGSRATSLERQSYRAAVRNKIASAYNALPSLSNSSSTSSQQQSPTSDPSKPTSRQPPPIPPRRNISSYPAAAAQYASNRISNGWNGWNGYNNDGSGGPEDGSGNDPVLSKKEELWLRRWQRAKEIFDEKGVVLRTWRVGNDVADEAVRLVERAKKEQSKR